MTTSTYGTRTDTVADGATALFSIGFSYLRQEYVKVFVDDVPVAFTFYDSSTVELNQTPPAGSTVSRVRQTNIFNPAVSWRPSAILTKENLDTITTQILHVVQEAYDNLGAEARSAVSEDVAEATQAAADALSSKSGAQSARNAAQAARDKAQDWANEDEDVAVETGLFSAFHWAKKAETFNPQGYLSRSGMIGEIRMFGGPPSDPGFVPCDGRELSRADYSELYAVVGNSWGNGNGSTTFNVPDFSTGNRFPRAAGGGLDVGDVQADQNKNHNHDYSGNTAGNGGHKHGFSANTSTNGNHNHTSSGNTNWDGGHSHTASASTNGNHSHDYWQREPGTIDDRAVSGGSQETLGGTTRKTTTTEGAHSHSININGVSNHRHSVTVNSDTKGAHSHNVNGNTDWVGGHGHAYSGTTTNEGGNEARPNAAAVLFYIFAR